jgi:hypothetical protein
MPVDQRQGPSLGAVLFVLAPAVIVLIVTAEYAAFHVLRSRAVHHAALPTPAWPYVQLRNRALPRLPLVGAGALAALALAYRGVARLSAVINRAKAKKAGMDLNDDANYRLDRIAFDLRTELDPNPDPEHHLLLGVGGGGAPVYLTDRARSMHLQVLGQAGSGKTQSVIFPKRSRS